jgi:hypothetical protein
VWQIGHSTETKSPVPIHDLIVSPGADTDRSKRVLHRSRIKSAGGREAVIEKFIHHFWSSKHGLTRERLLYKNIRAEIRNEQKALEFVEELGSSATNYAAVLSPSSDVWAGTGTRGRRLVEALRTLQMEQYKPLLLACLDVFDPGKPTELVKILRLLVSWSVRFQITRQLGSSEIEKSYPKVA